MARLDERWAEIATFGSAISVVSAVFFSILRLGLDTPILLAPAACSIFVAAAFAPLLLPRNRRFGDEAVRPVLLPLLSLAVIVSVFAGLWLGRIWLPIYPLLALAGILRSFRLAGRRPARFWLALFACGFIAAAYFFAMLSNANYAGAYTPEEGLVGLLNHDTRFHTAVTYLIQNFGTPSLGVDGILPLHYHFGSHAWFAAFGLIVGTEPLWTYAACVPIFLVPALVVTVIFAAAALDSGARSLWHYAGCGVALFVLGDLVGATSYVSESYLFGLIATILLLPLLVAMCRADPPPLLARGGLYLAIALIPVLTAFKVSAGVLWTVALGWLILRRRGLRITSLVLLVISVAVIVAALKFFAPGPGDYVFTSGKLIEPFYILRAFPWNLRILSSFLYPFCLLLLALASRRTTLFRAIRERADLPVELVIVVTLVGALPAYLGVPQDSAVWYFLNVGYWYAMPILVARLAEAEPLPFFTRLAAAPIGGPLLLVTGFLFLVPVVDGFNFPFYRVPGEIVRAASREGGGFLGGRLPVQYFKQMFSAQHVFFGSDFRHALADSTGARVIALVHAADPQPRADFAVYIPPSNREFWDFQSECRDKHNIQVSLTGRPSLLGGVPATYGCPRDAYQANYGTNFVSQVMSDAQLCQHARDRKIDDVFILADLRAATANRVLHCAR